MDRLVCTVKDLARYGFRNIPYKKCPKLMAVSSIEANITWLNVLPKKNVKSKTLSLSAIMLGTQNIDATHAKIQPGLYVHFKVIDYVKLMWW